MKHRVVVSLAGVSVLAIAGAALLAHPLVGQSVSNGYASMFGAMRAAQAFPIDGVQEMKLPPVVTGTIAKAEHAGKQKVAAKSKATRQMRRQARAVAQPGAYEVAANKPPQP